MNRKVTIVLGILTLIFSSLIGSVSAKTINKSPSSVKRVSFHSEALDKEMTLNIYLPEGYRQGKDYPVLYLLHKYQETQKWWFNVLYIQDKADKLIKAGTIKPMIIVSPQHDNSWGINSADVTGTWMGPPNIPDPMNEGRYEDYLVDEVVTYVDTNYATNPSRDSRFIGGASLGGYAALHIGLRNPELFGKIGAHAPAIFVEDPWAPRKEWMYPTEQLRESRDPLRLALKEDVSATQVMLDIGDRDDANYIEAVKQLEKNLRQNKVKSVVTEIVPGGMHDAPYWASQLEDYLRFYGSDK